MIERSWAEAYAREWAAHWNSRDLDALLRHYAADVTFRSPRIAVVMGGDQTSLVGVEALRAYWQRALELAPVLRFELDNVGVGSDSMTILYRNHRGDRVAETLVFGTSGKVIEGIVTYLASPGSGGA